MTRLSPPAAEQDFSDLLGELADALQVLYQCHAREVPVTPQLLNHIDTLLDQVEEHQVTSAQQRSPERSVCSGELAMVSAN